MPADGFDIVTPGWNLPSWERSYYPSDLPVDWQLTYFANEFPAVLVPRPSWVGAGESVLRSWSEDVHRRFRFYLDARGMRTAPPEALDRVRDLLASNFAGVVLDQTDPCPRDSGRACFQLCVAIESPPPANRLPAWRVPPSLIRDLRGAHAWLRTLADRMTCSRGLLLLASDQLEADDLRNWWDLIRLLGIAVS